MPALLLAVVLTAIAGLTASAQTVTTVNAASYASDTILAANSIAAAFGVFKTQDDTKVFSASGLPLPKTLGGVSVKVNNVDAELFFVSKNQINYVIPSGTPTQTVSVVVTNSDNSTVTGNVKINLAAPGIFSAKATGSGAAAAQTTTDGVVYKPVADASGNELVLDAGTTDKPNFLILYGTAIRGAMATSPNDGNGVAESCQVTIQGVPCEVTYAGPAPGFIGLDQLNVRIPPELAGLGSLSVKLTITTDTKPSSNTVSIKLGGDLPVIHTTAIAFGTPINGALTIDDQVEMDTREFLDDGSKNPYYLATYFLDAYRFSGTANQTIAIDLRSAQFDATVTLYRVDNGLLSYVGSDDISGGYSNAQFVNDNALLVTVLPETADYIIYATTSNVDPNGIGSYTLKMTANVMTPLTYGTSLASAGITTSDLQTSAGDYWDVYWFQGTKGDKVQIDMSSSAPGLDPYLVLQKANGDLVARDDNSLDGVKNARISPTSLRPLAELPETGKYIIIATPFAPNITGSYSLSLTKLSAAPAEGTQAAGSEATPPVRIVPDRDGLEDYYRKYGLNSARFSRRRLIR